MKGQCPSFPDPCAAAFLRPGGERNLSCYMQAHPWLACLKEGKTHPFHCAAPGAVLGAALEVATPPTQIAATRKTASPLRPMLGGFNLLLEFVLLLPLSSLDARFCLARSLG